MTTIITKNGSGAPTAGQLSQGELAVDLTNKELYTKDSGGNVIKVGGTGGGEAGTFTDLTATSSFTSPGIDDNATSTAITIDASGDFKVGSGSKTYTVGSGAYELDIAGGLNLSSGRDNGASMTFEVSNTEKMRIDAGGNVGIGTDSPISLGAGTQGITIKGSAGGFTNYQYNAANTGYLVAASDALSINTFTGKNLVLGTEAVERMRLDSSGNLLVGKTTDPTVGTGHYIKPNGETYHTITTGLNTLHVYSTSASAFRFYVGNDGTVHATNTSISAISDASLKENIRDLDKGLDTINSLQPRRFDWKNGDGNDIMGFIAQEVEEVMPELIDEAQYNKDETKKSLRTGDMIPSMVKAIQELSTQVSELKAEVAALKGA